MYNYNNMTVIVCSNCNKKLKKGEKKYCEENSILECAECLYRTYSNTRKVTISVKTELSMRER